MRVLLWALLTAGCARAELPVRHVVVYRNGVAYFERGGRVDRNEVQFTVKPGDVGDFLATLAVVGASGSAVRAAALPAHFADADGTGRRNRETVILTLDGAAHDVRVGYVAASPVWKPSYRLVLQRDRRADLQVWGIVENFSGEDWNGVKLSLVAGAPIAFQVDLGTALLLSRPLVHDPGEENGAVPQGETVEAWQTDRATVAQPQSSRRRSSSGNVADSDYGYQATAPAASLPEAPAATVAAGEAGFTRYDVASPVTIPDRGASMIMVVSRKVAGESLLLYAPDAGIADSATHPFRAASFTNGTSGTIERGPIAMFEDGAFVGQGVLGPLPAGAVATLPFALERSVEVTRVEGRPDTSDRARVAAIEDGALYIHQADVTRTIYRMHNGGDAPATVVVKHARIAHTQLVSPPEGTRDDTEHATALVPATVPGHGSADLAVSEGVFERRKADWLTDLADDAVKAYLADPASPPDIVQKLSAAWVLRRDLIKKTAEQESLRQQSYTLTKEAPRLAETGAKLAACSRRIADLDGRIATITGQLDKTLWTIHVSGRP